MSQRVRSWGGESNLGTVLAYTKDTTFEKVEEGGIPKHGDLEEFIITSPLFDVLVNGATIEIKEKFDLKSFVIGERWRGDCKVLLNRGEYKLSTEALKSLLFDHEVGTAIAFKAMLEKALRLLVKEEVSVEWKIVAGARVESVKLLNLP